MSDLEFLLKEAEKRICKGENNLAKGCDVRDIRELHFELTYQCNEQCIMCDIWPHYKKSPALKEKELTSEEIFNFVNKSMYLKNLNMVLFSGGEPFLREDLPELCGFFVNRYKTISIGVLSNLLSTQLILKRVKQITDYEPSDFWIGSSIDGIGNTHDIIRGRNGAFKALENSIDVLKREYPQVRLGLNFTLTTENYHELEKAYDYAKERGLDFSAQFAVPWEDAIQFSWTEEQITTVKESIYRILEKMVKDYNEQKLLRRIDKITGANLYAHLLSTMFYWKGLIDYQEKPYRRFNRCVAGSRFVQVSPKGDLYFCPLLKKRIIGNIRDYNYDFDSIWISSEATKSRKFVASGKCHCWLNCTIYPNIQDALGLSPTPTKLKMLHWGRRILSSLRIAEKWRP